MGNERFLRCEDSTLDEGVVVSRSNIDKTLSLHSDTVNITMGMYDGIGPRYGMAPIPTHNHSEAPAATTDPAGLQVSEGTGAYFQRRVRVFGVFSIKLSDYDNPKTKITVYLWIGSCMPTSDAPSSTIEATSDRLFATPGVTKSSVTLGTTYFDLENMASTATVNYYKYAKNIDAGLSFPTKSLSYGSGTGWIASSVRRHGFGVGGNTDIGPIDLANLGKYNKYFCSSAVASISGRDIPANKLLAHVYPTQLGAESGTTAAKLSLTYTGSSKELDSLQQIKTRNFKVKHIARIAGVQYLKSIFAYSNANPYTLTAMLSLKTVNTNVSFPSGATVTNGTTASIGAEATYLALFEMDNHNINSSYALVAMAGLYPVIGIIQEHVKPIGAVNASQVDNWVQYVDPTDIRYVDSSSYTEDGLLKKTMLSNFPSYVTGTPLIKESAATASNMVTLGAENSGVLRKNSIYELTYSIFDKSINYETNVFEPVRFLVDDEDFVSLSIFRQASGEQRNAISYTSAFPFLKIAEIKKVNWTQYRVYYRALGTFEWIPAGVFDAAEFFDPTIQKLSVCVGQTAALPGGQPGGFNDYSNLQKDEYTNVLFFEKRLFWLSNKNLSYSLKQNPMAYPIRNAISCPKGNFVGMIAHAFPGQASNYSRVVVFGTEETYTGTFKGLEFALTQPVRVSENSISEFPLEGSDFYLDTWTSVTSFSGRSAVVADGILYFWGPSGIRRDNGSELPDRVSAYREPDIFHYYDTTKVDEICSVFNARTKEVIWFYRPNPLLYASKTRALIYNTLKDCFYDYDFGSIYVDWGQVTDVLQSNTNDNSLANSRVIIGVRDQAMIDAGNVTSRAVYFDDFVEAGDWRPSKSTLCVAIDSLGSNVYRFYFTSGFPSGTATTGTVTLYSTKAYQDETGTNFDGVYSYTNLQVMASGTFTGRTAIDINFTGITNKPSAINMLSTPRKYMPVWFHTYQEFTVRIKFNQWAPWGNNFYGQWVYSHTIYKLDLIQGSAPTLSYRYYSLIGTDYDSSSITLEDNSRGHCQVYNQLKDEKENNSGQSMALEILSGSAGAYCGSRWILQYLSFDVVVENGEHLKRFEQ